MLATYLILRVCLLYKLKKRLLGLFGALPLRNGVE